jgi:deoxyribonuclease V
MPWPVDADSLIAAQEELAVATPSAWQPDRVQLLVGGCWVCFPRGLTGRGSGADPAWVAALVLPGTRTGAPPVDVGRAGAPYVPGLLALRMGRLLEEAVTRLRQRPDVLLLDASGRDHPRRAGLALHLGAVLDMPTVGITHRPLLADGAWPGERRGDTSPLRVGDTVVACWLRTQPGVRPLVVHPGWAVDLDTALELVLSTAVRRRTPEPVRRARRLARRARAAATLETGGPEPPLDDVSPR